MDALIGTGMCVIATIVILAGTFWAAKQPPTRTCKAPTDVTPRFRNEDYVGFELPGEER